MARVIINADDFGLARGVNRGIEKAAAAGTLSSVSVLVTETTAGEIADFARRWPKISIGIHLNLTQGYPLLSAQEVPSLVTKGGKFFQRRQLLLRSSAGLVNPKHIRAEIRAQIGQLHNLGVTPSHADFHQGLVLLPGVFPHVLMALRSAGIRRMRGHRVLYLHDSDGGLHRKVLETIGFHRQHPRQTFTFAYRYLLLRMEHILGFTTPDGLITDDTIFAPPASSYADRLGWGLQHLPQGCTAELMTHPAIMHGYLRRVTSFIEQRERDLDLLTSPAFKDALDRADVSLISYRDL